MRDEITVATADDMVALGKRLAACLRPGDLVVLNGTLGAGKTTLVQGIGAGLGVRGPVTSPTFVIARVHPSLTGGPALVHADAYRLASPAEVDDLDLDASLETSVTVVEWGGGLVEGLAADRLEVSIALSAPGSGPSGPDDEAAAAGPDQEPRTVRLEGYGARWRTPTAPVPSDGTPGGPVPGDGTPSTPVPGEGTPSWPAPDDGTRGGPAPGDGTPGRPVTGDGTPAGQVPSGGPAAD